MQGTGIVAVFVKVCSSCGAPKTRLIWTVMFLPDGLCLICWNWAMEAMQRWLHEADGPRPID